MAIPHHLILYRNLEKKDFEEYKNFFTINNNALLNIDHNDLELVSSLRKKLITIQDILIGMAVKIGLCEHEIGLIKLPLKIQTRTNELQYAIKRLQKSTKSSLQDSYSFHKNLGFSEDEIQSWNMPIEETSCKREDLLDRIFNSQNTQIHKDDLVSAWLNSSISSHLMNSDIKTIAELIGFINENGSRWFTRVPKLGKTSAKLITQFLRHNQMFLFDSKIHPFSMINTRKEADSLVIQGNCIINNANAYKIDENDIIDVDINNGLCDSKNQPISIRRRVNCAPIELFAVPAHLSGDLQFSPRNRQENVIAHVRATNDYEAILEWLNIYKSNKNSFLSYKKEVERLMLWSILVKKKAISDLVSLDFAEFKDFLSNPSPAELWISHKKYPRMHPKWKPFFKSNSSSGGLGTKGISYAFTVINRLFEFLVSQNYLKHNIIKAVPKTVKGKRDKHNVSDRIIPNRIWNMVEEKLLKIPQRNTYEYRTAFIVKFLQVTGLRLEEIVNVKLGDFKVYENDSNQPSWILSVRGKGAKLREIAIVAGAIKMIGGYLKTKGLHPDPRMNDSNIPLISHICENNAQGNTKFLSRTRVYRGIKLFFSELAEEIREESPVDYLFLKKISTHWLRHTFASQLIKRADVSIVMKMLGHSNLQTTSQYIHSEREEIEKAMNGTFDF